MLASKFFATGLALAAGCSGARTERPVVTTTDQGRSTASPSGIEVAKLGKSLVRLVNALPSKRSIDVAGGGRKLFTGVAYRSVTPYAEVQDNSATFRMEAAGTDSALADSRATMRDGYRYTIVALPLDYDGVRLRKVRDEVAADASKARIRVFNAAPAVRHADVAIQGQKDALFADLGYAAEARQQDIDPMTATIEIRRGTGLGRTILLKNLRFEAGKSYTIVLTGWRPTEVETIMFDDTVAGGLPTISLGTRP